MTAGLPSHLPVPDAGFNPFIFVRVRISPRLVRTVSWQVRDSFQDRNGVFQVERSEENGPWTPVGDIVDGLSTDLEIATLEPDRLVWWRVVLKGALGDYPSDPVQEGNHPGNNEDLLYTNAIFRREYTTLLRYSGTKGFILHPRKTGRPCPQCSLEGVGAPLRSNCQYCDGTGLAEGYYPAEDLYVAVLGAANPTRTTSPAIGVHMPGAKVKGRTVASTLIGNGDVWCNDRTGDRYLIGEISPEVVYKDMVIGLVMEMELLDTGRTNAVNTPSVMEKLPFDGPPSPRRPLSFDDLDV